MTNSLKFKLTACVCGALVLIHAAMLVSETRLVSRQLAARAENNARTLSQTIEKSLRGAMVKRRRDEIRAIISSVAELPQIGDIAILDETGRTIIGNQAMANNGKDSVVRKMVGTAARTGAWTSENVKGDILRMVSPIRNERRCWGCHGSHSSYLGHLLVDLSMHDDREALARNLGMVIAEGIADLVVTAIIVLVLLSTLVYRPIGRLMETMRRIKAGDITARADTTAGDELCRVSEALNAMIVSLEERNAEIVKTSERLQEAKKLATVGCLAAGLAHEINNPNAAISMAAEGLARRVPADWPEHRLVELIGASSDRIASLVSELLRFDPNQPRKLEPIDVNEVVRQAVELASKGSAGPKHLIDVELAADIRDVVGDADRLRGAVVNVVTNALEAMPKGGSLIVRTSGTDREVSIRVSDTGHGIAEEDLPLVMEPFFTRKETERGRGLGLAIAHEAVAQHGGELVVSSQVDQGSCVHIRIPRKK